MSTEQRHTAENDAARKRARCGADYEHAWHAYRHDDDDRRHVCDGQLRTIPPGRLDA
jgi:hypothetical protein